MDVAALAGRVVALPRGGVALALSVPDRVADVWSGAVAVVDRVTYLTDRIDALLVRLELAVDRVDRELDRVGGEVDYVEVVAQRVHQVVEAGAAVATTAGLVAADAGRTSVLADQQVQRLQSLLDDYQESMRSLAPLVRRAVRELRPGHVASVMTLLDQLPSILERIEPALTSMTDMAPGLEQVSERMDNVGQVVEGLPGAGILRRRGRERSDETEQPEDAER